jgi:flagellar hook-associated protein FlgK
MATIQKIRRTHDIAYRVLIRQANTKPTYHQQRYEAIKKIQYR